MFTAHKVLAGWDEKRARTPGLKLLGRGFVPVLIITVGLAGRIQQQLQHGWAQSTGFFLSKITQRHQKKPCGDFLLFTVLAIPAQEKLNSS